MSSPAVRQCEREAETQYGHISREQALGFGVTDRQIERLVAGGAWIRVHPGVYRMAGAPQTREGSMMAALLRSGPAAFFSHKTAAFVLKLDGVDTDEIEISAYSGRSIEGVVVHRLRPTDRPRLRTLQGFRITGVERTLLDLAGSMHYRKIALALDDALRRRLTTLERLWQACRDHGGSRRRGSKVLKKLLSVRDDRDGKLASKLEAKLFAILKRIEPDKLEAQFLVQDGTRRFFLDFAYPHAHLGIEGIGLKFHFGEVKLKRDFARDRRLTLLGWHILYFTWDDVCFQPDMVEAEVRQALASCRLLLLDHRIGG